MEANEICLLWGDWQIQRWWSCMTKAEWSGWMQAIGAVLAILGAFYLSKIQESSNQLRLKKSAVIRVKVFASNVLSCARILGKVEVVEELEMMRHQAFLKETLAVGLAIPVEVLNGKWLHAFETSRLIATQLALLCDVLAKDDTKLPEAMIIIKRLVAHVDKIEGIVSKSYPGVNFSEEEWRL